MRVNRRRFLAGAATCIVGSRCAGRSEAAEPIRLATFLDWQRASRDERPRALQPLAARIRELDRPIHAWVQVAPETPTGSGALDSIPFGVKDIIETKGLATEYGSPIYKSRIGTDDAAIVRDLRRRGGVVMGKTHTTSFAFRTPAPTRNPRDLAHTPGGSSSGSAAAVAAGMIPFAIGTQTGGSMLRPASYCGITGLKPTYGLFSMEGVLPLAQSLDTLGFFTNSTDDMLALWGAMGQSIGSAEQFPLAVPDPMPAVEPEMRSAIAAAVAQLRSAGWSISTVVIAPMLEKLA